MFIETDKLLLKIFANRIRPSKNTDARIENWRAIAMVNKTE